MNRIKCEQIMDSFYGLDKGERLPFKSSLHLISCKECRTNVRILTKAEKLSKKPLREILEFKNGNISDVIRNTIPTWREKIKPVSMVNWIICGLLMIVMFIGGGHYISLTQNQTYLTWFYLIFAAAISSYCSAFVAVNLDFFVKKIDTKKLV